MKCSVQSLRTHIIAILLVKLVVMVGLRLAYFPALEQQHLPSDLYLDSSARHSSLKASPLEESKAKTLMTKELP